LLAVVGLGSLIALGIAGILGTIAEGICELEADGWACAPLTGDAFDVVAPSGAGTKPPAQVVAAPRRRKQDADENGAAPRASRVPSARGHDRLRRGVGSGL